MATEIFHNLPDAILAAAADSAAPAMKTVNMPIGVPG